MTKTSLPTTDIKSANGISYANFSCSLPFLGVVRVAHIFSFLCLHPASCVASVSALSIPYYPFGFL